MRCMPMRNLLKYTSQPIDSHSGPLVSDEIWKARKGFSADVRVAESCDNPFKPTSA
jgi:hypothetical protein